MCVVVVVLSGITEIVYEAKAGSVSSGCDRDNDGVLLLLLRLAGFGAAVTFLIGAALMLMPRMLLLASPEER